MDTYAFTLCKAGRYKEAEELLQKAIQVAESASMDISWEYYYHLGMAQEGLGQDSQSALSYKRASELSKRQQVSSYVASEIKEAIQRVESVQQ